MRQTSELPKRQALNLKASHSFASEIGRPLSQLLTIHWGLAPTDVSPQERWARMLEYMRHWLVNRGQPFMHVWAHEQGTTRSLHTHALIHVPPKYRADLKAQIKQWIGNEIPAKTIDIRADDGGGIGYIIKDVRPDHYQALNIQPTYINKRSPKSRPIAGKRAGTSQNLGPKARAAHTIMGEAMRPEARA